MLGERERVQRVIHLNPGPSEEHLKLDTSFAIDRGDVIQFPKTFVQPPCTKLTPAAGRPLFGGTMLRHWKAGDEGRTRDLRVGNASLYH